ncbi:MAG: hypothetical protein ACJ739_13040 [Acidimicrobiales bacterium]
MADLEDGAVSSNGSTPHVDDREAALSSLRSRPENVHLFRGYGPLIVGAVLFVLMLVLAPSVAPEHVVEQPVNGTTTTTTTTTSTTEAAP